MKIPLLLLLLSFASFHGEFHNTATDAFVPYVIVRRQQQQRLLARPQTSSQEDTKYAAVQGFTNKAPEEVKKYGITMDLDDAWRKKIDQITTIRPYPLFLLEKGAKVVDDMTACLLMERKKRDDGDRKEHLVILGTGWGAASLLKSLKSDRYDVTVISPRNYFLFTRKWHWVCTGQLPLGISQSLQSENIVRSNAGWSKRRNCGVSINHRTCSRSKLLC